MARIAYVEKNFTPAKLDIINLADQIAVEYMNDGYTLTQRQLYYQFVSRDIFPESWIDREYNLKHGLDPDTVNTFKNVKRLMGIVNDARLAGYIDWDAIEDRTRNLNVLSYWEDPADIIDSAASSYRTHLWASQPYYLEVWIEKEALAGVFQRACEKWHVPFFSCKGYPSLSEMHDTALRLINRTQDDGKHCRILHFGDHDPSGIDMTRDIRDRLETFGADLEVQRHALNIDQVEKWNPPPNFAKATDSRYKAYRLEFGTDCWEIDALEPATLADLTEQAILDLLDRNAWEVAVDEMEEERKQLKDVSGHWDDITSAL
jgi:hypothetical protein